MKKPKTIIYEAQIIIYQNEHGSTTKYRLFSFSMIIVGLPMLLSHLVKILLMNVLQYRTMSLLKNLFLLVAALVVGLADCLHFWDQVYPIRSFIL